MIPPPGSVVPQTPTRLGAAAEVSALPAGGRRIHAVAAGAGCAQRSGR